MPRIAFTYFTGLKTRTELFAAARLRGSWDGQGRYASAWSEVAMEAGISDDGCRCFRATVAFDDAEIGKEFRWDVVVNGPGGPNVHAMQTEGDDADSPERYRKFVLRADLSEQHYYLTHCRRLGANKFFPEGASEPAIRFSVWAPNARAVEMVTGDRDTGYIYNPDPGPNPGPGRGQTSAPGAFPMRRDGDGVWHTDLAASPGLRSFADFEYMPYMYRITKDDGSVAYRTDLYSRCQVGGGMIDPESPHAGAPPFTGKRKDLDGSVGCSMVLDPDLVRATFEEPPEGQAEQRVAADEFWRDEFDPLRPVPNRIEDLVIYELHVGGLGFGRQGPGNLGDAIALLDYLADLGVNAIELLPLSEFEGRASWGYGTSHFLAIEFSGGGPNQFKHLVRECHRRGIAVLLDVVYNHYQQDSERAAWAYDSNLPERNICYWYEGHPSDYPAYEEAARRDPQQFSPGHGGYVDNDSTGYAPRFDEDMVRKLFLSSAAMLLTEFHLDGFRVDQTTSIHGYAKLHADRRPADRARAAGVRFLRELTRTLRLIKPRAILIAEDHSGWPPVTRAADVAGLGFDAAWYADYYHHLIGDASNDASRARLLHVAGQGGDQPLAMDYFAGALRTAASDKVIYHESHDEAGNSSYEENGERVHSARTIVVAVNRAPLVGETRRYAEARCRFACGITMLAAATPMFFMGEEIGAAKDYRYDADEFLSHREDLRGERAGDGRFLFRFYQDIIRFRQKHDALRSSNIEILHVHDANRVLIFRRWAGSEEFLVMASLNNQPFAAGYIVEHPSIPAARWKEVFNSSHRFYTGDGARTEAPMHGDAHHVPSVAGRFDAPIPANGLVVYERDELT